MQPKLSNITLSVTYREIGEYAEQKLAEMFPGTEFIIEDIEDDDEGIPYLDTHRHVTETTLAGLTYARIVEIINGYTVEFEDGQYTVNCVGANHNVSDVKVSNQVSLIVNNAAGLITNTAIEYSSFNGGVSIDVTSSNTGTVFPTGNTRPRLNIRRKPHPRENGPPAQLCSGRLSPPR